MSRDERLGHAVADGLIRYLSVSALAKADPREHGCFRRWAYRYVFGFTEAENEKAKKSKEAGGKLHAELEHYLRTGEKALSSLAMRGLHFVPRPDLYVAESGDIVGRDLFIEYPLHEILPDGTVKSPLTAAGIPVVGYMDCAHGRGINQGASDVTETQDPPYTVEVIDWKYKGNTVDRYGNSTLIPAERLIYTTQMAGYGEWFRRTWAHLTHIRLSHGVFPAKGGEPRKITKLHVIDDCARTWEYVEGVARSIVDVAKETDVNKVPANLMACEMYGGCPHRAYCTAAQNNSLSRLFGETAASELQKEMQMGLLEQVETPQLSQDLATEEARLRAQQQQIMSQPAVAQMQPIVQHTNSIGFPQLAEPVTTPQVPAPARPDGTVVTVQPDPESIALLQTWNGIVEYQSAIHPTMNEPMGFPALGGAAAQAIAKAKGFQLNGAGLGGTGVLGRVMTIFEVSKLGELLSELRQKIQLPPQNVTPPGVGTIPNVSVLGAPPSPAPNPAPIPMPSPSAPLPQNVPMMLPPEAPAPIPALAAKPPDGTPQAAQVGGTVHAAEAPKKRKHKPKNPPSASQPNVVAGASSSASLSPTQASFGGLQTSEADGADLEVFIDCVPNQPFTSLALYVHQINMVLAKKYCVMADGRPTTQDVRTAPKDSPLAFAGWEGAVFEMVLLSPPADDTYYLDTRGNRLAQVVASALEVVCANRNALFAKGF